MRDSILQRVKILSACVGIALVAGASSSARAASMPVTFAEAFETAASSNSNLYAYNDNGSDAELGTSTGGALGAAVPINFQYEPGAGTLPADLQGLQSATLSMTSSTLSPVTTSFGGTVAQQPITGLGAGGTVTDTIKITRTTPATEGGGSRTNLLTVTFTGKLQGTIGAPNPSLIADTTAGDTVTYTSDFLSFAQSTAQDFNVGFSSWDPLVTPPSGLGIDASDNYYNSATAAAVSVFDFESNSTVIPEPASLPILIFSGLALVLFGERRVRVRPR